MDVHEVQVKGDAEVTTITVTSGALLSQSEHNSDRTPSSLL